MRRPAPWLALALLVAPCLTTPLASQAVEADPPPRVALITPEALVPLLDSVSVLDVRAAWSSYLQNHLPNAAWLSIETLRAQNGELPFQLLEPGAYASLFRRIGVDPRRMVVVYSAGDQLDIDATFTAWLLSAMGVPRVRVLDGGFARWELEGRPLTQRYPRRPVPPGMSGRGFRPAVASLEQVQAASRGNGVLLVDARPPEQFAGSAGAQMRRGHIPGAVNHPWKDDLEKRDLALVWKSVADLRAAYAAQGITPDKDIILYCNSGTEASHVWFALSALLGYPRVRIFTGSWTQWAEREELPVEK